MASSTRRSIVIAVGLLVSMGWAASSSAGVITYLTKASFDLAVSTTLLEDFESFTPKNTALPSFVSNGVTYTGLAGSPTPNVFVASPGYTNFGAGVGTTTSSILVANGDEDFTLTFSTPLFAIGFDVYFNGLGPVTTTINTTGSPFVYVDNRGLNTKEYYGFVSTDPITSLRFTSTGGAVLNTGIDNIAVRPVPEPGTLALIGLGLAGLGLRRRRARAEDPDRRA